VASIRKLPSGRYRVRWRDAGGHERGDTAPTKKAALELKAKVELDAFRGRAHDPAKGQQAFGDYLTQVLEDDGSIGPATRDLYTSVASNHIIPALGGYAIGGIRPEDLRRFYTSLRKKGTGDPTIEKVHLVISRTFNQAIDEGVVEMNPAMVAGKKLRRGGRTKPRIILTQRQVIELALVLDRIDELRHQGTRSAPKVELLRDDLQAARNVTDTDLLEWYVTNSDGSIEDTGGTLGYGRMVVVATWAGLRFGEVAALRHSSRGSYRDDDDVWRSTLTISEAVAEVAGKVSIVSPKTKAGRRTIHIGSEIARLLDHHEYLQDEAGRRDLGIDGLLFTTTFGHPLSYNRFMRRFWRPSVDFLQMDPRPTGFHDLRHTHEQWLLDRRHGPKTVQGRLGHASARTTLDVYAQFSPGTDAQAADDLERPPRGT
jgi:integrase